VLRVLTRWQICAQSLGVDCRPMPCQLFAGPRVRLEIIPTDYRPSYRYNNMGNTIIYVLWLAAVAVLLAAYVARRRKRKVSTVPVISMKN
jgi:hypothetical protein